MRECISKPRLEYTEHPSNVSYSNSKLPGGLMNRWKRTVQAIRRKQIMEPDLQDLILFVEEEKLLRMISYSLVQLFMSIQKVLQNKTKGN